MDNPELSGWLNIYKPCGISSAKAISSIKRAFPKRKVGHAGTLDVEAQGVLPVAIGEATKLIQFLIDAKKTYKFTVQFGSQTDTGDKSGKIIKTTFNIPSEEECKNVCARFLGQIKQRPNIFSAIKVNGIRSYKLAREGQNFELAYRNIFIYDLQLIGFDSKTGSATYIAECSKGTYIRTLAEDIALYLQSLGFVIELERTKVGIFQKENAIDFEKLNSFSNLEKSQSFVEYLIRIEAILDDISVIEATSDQATQIKFGRPCRFLNTKDLEQVWIKYNDKLLAIGSVKENCFNSIRVFNIT